MYLCVCMYSIYIQLSLCWSVRTATCADSVCTFIQKGQMSVYCPDEVL